MAEPGVIIFMDGPPKDWRRAALALANACPGLTYADAARACRCSQGFLELVLKPEQLEAAAHALATSGSTAAVLPTSRRVSAPPAFTLLRMGIDDLGFSGLEPKSPSFARVQWKRVKLIHLAWVGKALRDPENDRFEPSSAPESSSSSEPPELWLELVLMDPLARLRIRMSSFVYDCLPEVAPRSEVNLRELVKAIIAHAPKALESGLVEACLGGESLEAEPIDPSELDRHVSWELSRLALLEGKELTPAPPPEAPLPPREEPVGIDRTALLLAKFRRRVLVWTSIPLAVALCSLVFVEYPGLPIRMVIFMQFALWLPIVALLSLLYVGVQLGVDAMKERAP